MKGIQVSTLSRAAVASGLLVQALALPLRGSVTDAGGRPVAGVTVAAACDGRSFTGVTDADGGFEFHVVGERCVVVVIVGAAKAVVECRSNVEAVRCAVAVPVVLREASVDVAAPPLLKLSSEAVTGVDAVALSAEQLKVFGADAADWLRAAVARTGLPPGRPDLRVDGQPVAVMPPASTVRAIRVNADPFAADVDGTDFVRVDVTSAAPASGPQFDVRIPPLRRQSREPVLGGAPGRSSDVSLTLGWAWGTVTQLWMLASAERQRHEDRPTYLAGPVGSEVLLADLSTVSNTDRAYAEAGVSRPTWSARWVSSRSTQSISNGGVGGTAGPPLAADLRSTISTHQVAADWSAARARVGGRLTISNDDGHEVARGEGQSVWTADRLVDGAASTVAASSRRSTVFARLSVASSATGGWLAGADFRQNRLEWIHHYNPAGGRISMGSAPVVTFTRPDGPAVSARETMAALYGQQTVVASRRAWLRLGGQVVWQERLGVIIHPRVSAAAPFGRFIVAANVGTFADGWSADAEGELRARRQSPVTYSSEAVPVETRGTRGRRRDVVIRVAVVRPLNAFRARVQHTWTRGRLGGLARHRVTGLVDELSFDRRLDRHQVAASIEWSRRSLQVDARYTWTSSIDDSDGLFALPAWSDRRGERAPSTAVPRHVGTAIVAGSGSGRVDWVIAVTATSGAPYTRMTGADPDGLLSFRGRADVTRNAGRTPADADVSVYLRRRWSVPVARLSIDTGVRLLRLVGTSSVLAVDPVAASRYAGQVIRSGGGRRIEVWATLGR